MDQAIEFAVAAIVAGVANRERNDPSITNSDDATKRPVARNKDRDARNGIFLPGEESDDSLMKGHVAINVLWLQRLADR